MFWRKKDSYLNIILPCLAIIHTLIKKQAEYDGTQVQSFNLNAFASMLDNVQKLLPRLFSLLSDYEKQKFSYWFLVQYDLIHFNEESLSMFFPQTNDQRLSVVTIDAFYAFQNDVRDYYIQSPHAVILFQNTLYHYDCSNQPHSLTEISKPSTPSDYDCLKTKLTKLPKKLIQHASPKERGWISSSVGIEAEIKNRPIDVDLLEKFLTLLQNTAKKQLKEWRSLKNQFLFYTPLIGCGTLAVFALQDAILIGLRYLLTGVIIPSSTITGLMNIALLGAGFIVIAGVCIALIAYMQESFCNRLMNVLTQIETTPGSNTSITAFNFIQNHRLVLDSAFTKENYLRAGISP